MARSRGEGMLCKRGETFWIQFYVDRYHIVSPADVQEASRTLAEPGSAIITATAASVTPIRRKRKAGQTGILGAISAAGDVLTCRGSLVQVQYRPPR